MTLAATLHDLTRQVESVNACDELQRVVAKAFAEISAQTQGMQNEIDKIAPVLEALSPLPTTPDEVVGFIEKLVAVVLAPYIKPYLSYVAQAEEISSAVFQLTAAVNEAESKFTSCVVTIPVVGAIVV